MKETTQHWEDTEPGLWKPAGPTRFHKECVVALMSHRWHWVTQAEPGAASADATVVAVTGRPTRPVSSGSCTLQACFLSGSV